VAAAVAAAAAVTVGPGAAPAAASGVTLPTRLANAPMTSTAASAIATNEMTARARVAAGSLVTERVSAGAAPSPVTSGDRGTADPGLWTTLM
jgi:2,4-dienoyl-CoA reductase-like NADH-dependent reductase (Old Yellow Enzyme family)